MSFAGARLLVLVRDGACCARVSPGGHGWPTEWARKEDV